MRRGRLAFAGLALGAALGCGGGATAPCDFTVGKNALSAKIPTVGVIEWALSGPPPSSAKIVFRLQNAAASVTNRGGEAPVDLTRANHRTLLLGLKQASDYTFHIEAARDGQTCVSSDYALPATGRLDPARAVGVDVAQPQKREAGFIVTSSGTSVPDGAFILDADGDLVWSAGGPANTTRASMDYEGQNLWMIALNLLNEGGEMRYVSMDGEEEHDDVPGLSDAHHDFTVMPAGKIAALVWQSGPIDPPSNLVIRSPDGSTVPAFEIGANLYASDSFHANAVHFIPFDGGFTIADRNPNLLVKVSAAGTVDWQLGGSCAGAPAGPRCSPQSWQVNHGHHLLDDGTFLLFNNGQGDASHVFEFKLTDTPSAFAAAQVEDYTGTFSSSNMGDVQRLPGGNTLITYATAGKIVEVDGEWREVQTFTVRVGYASWRPTLYGPPARP